MDVPSKRIHTFELCVGGLLSVVSVAIASLSDAKVSFSLAKPNITFLHIPFLACAVVL